MKAIQHTSTLFYYDGPQVIEARDAIGGHYVAVLLEPDNGQERYLVMGVAPERLRLFRAGRLDLRALMIEGVDEWYLAAVTAGLDRPLALVPQTASLETSGYLPDAGFLLHDEPTDQLALQEARERNNLVLQIAAEPPEAVSEHRIRLETLIGLLGHVQKVVKHAYGAALREVSAAARELIDRADGHLLDVIVPAGAGSFRVVLEAARTPDMLGQSELARALRMIDVLFEDASDPAKTLTKLKARRGHLAGGFLRLLQFLAEHNTGLKYWWAEPDFKVPNFRSVSEREVESLVSILSGVADLGSEPVTLVGEFDKFNRETGAWGLKVGGKMVSGKTREGGPSLTGLKAGARYTFSCIEKIEEVEGTGREQHTLYLLGHEPA